MKKITGNMTFAEVMKKYPNLVPIFLKYGLSCIGCPFAAQETIEQGCIGHGISTKELLDELNNQIQNE